jgi:hypothetical protein
MLDLHLAPIAPSRRSPSGGQAIQCGYRLQLPDGYAIEENDPLLACFGIVIPRVASSGCEEALQHADAAPGARLLVLPSIDDADDEASVWSADGVRLMGVLQGCDGEQVAAAAEFGVPLCAVVLDEWCDARTGRRTAIDVLVAPAAAVRLHVPDGTPLRPERRERRRLVLIADGRADLALWDPAGGHGPLDAGDLCLSRALHERLAALRRRLAARDDATVPGGLDGLVASWEDEALEHEARTVWRRLRAELGRRCEVGYIGPGMVQAVWDLEDLADEEDEELAF